MQLSALFQPSLWWLVLAPLAMFPPVYALRRFRLGGWLAIVFSLLLAYVALITPRGNVTWALGRPIVYDDTTAYVIALLFAATACLFALSLSVPQGWTFYPFSLIILALFTAAMVSRHLGIIALLVEVAALLSVLIIQGGRLGAVRAALRFVVLMTLAMPFFLLAAWRIDQYWANANNAVFLSQVTLLVASGFVLWLGIVPLHGWLSGIASEAEPGIAAFILMTFPTIALVNLLHLLSIAPWLTNMPLTLDIVLAVGLFSAVIGGLFASVQRAFGPLMGYATIFDVGASLIALGLGNEQGLNIILLSIFARTFALLLIAVSSAAIQAHASDDSFAQARGLAANLPLATVGLGVGALTLVGIPFTVGFVPRWLLWQSLAGFEATLSLGLSLAGLGVAIGYIRGLRALVEPQDTTRPAPLEERVRGTEPLIVGLMILCCGLGIFPQSLLALVEQLTQSLKVPIF